MAEINRYWADIAAAADDAHLDLLAGKSILVTGATGLIGSCLIDILMTHERKAYTVYALGRNEARAKLLFGKYADDSHFRFIRHDITKPMEGDTRFDLIVNAASAASPSAFVREPVEIIKANIDGLALLTDYGMAHGMERLVYVSSAEVYGNGNGEEFTEEMSGYVDPMSPRSCYPSSKRAAETLCAAYKEEYGADVCVARPCHTYGPHFTESDNRVYAQFIRSVLRGEDITLKSPGQQLRSWCYVVDCARALLCILLRGESGKAYNIADRQSVITIRELAEMIAEIGGSRVVFDLPTEEERKVFNPIRQSTFSTARIESLGWQVSGTMREKLLATIEEARRIGIFGDMR